MEHRLNFSLPHLAVLTLIKKLLVLLADHQKAGEIGRASHRILVSPIILSGGSSLTLLADLTGVGISETIKGIQDAGVIACAKHFIGNEQVYYPNGQQILGV